MLPLSFFEERIDKNILRGSTLVPVTENNYKKLFELQDEKKGYLFTEMSKRLDK